MKKRIVLLISIIITCVFLSGCIRVERGIEFQSKGMVTVSEKVLVQQGLASYGMGSYNTNYLQEMGFDVDTSAFPYEVENVTETVDSTAYEGVLAHTTISETDAEDALEEIMGDDVTVTITRSGTFLKHIVVDIVNNSSTANTNVSKYTGGGYGASMMGMGDVFIIRTPFIIVDTNGDKNTKDLRSASFDMVSFDSDQVSEVHMEVTYLNLLPVIIGGVGVVCIIIMVIILIIVNTKKKKNMTEPIGL